MYGVVTVTVVSYLPTDWVLLVGVFDELLELVEVLVPITGPKLAVLTYCFLGPPTLK